jgi:hypothetical protein
MANVRKKHSIEFQAKVTVGRCVRTARPLRYRVTPTMPRLNTPT